MNIETIEAPKPSIIDESSLDYREDLVLRRGYFYLYNKEVIVSKAIFSAEVKGSEEKMNWIVWVKIPADKFIEMTENIKNDKGRLLGELMSPILFYELCGSKKVEVEFDYKSKDIVYPRIAKLYFSGRVADIFENGIPLEEYSDIQSKLR